MDGMVLKSLEVKAKLLGLLADVSLRQIYTNGLPEAVEFTYLFPIPPEAQVTGFTVKLGDRLIKSEIEETEDAFKKYDKAIGKGNTAAIIESLRKDILELSLGNLLPGETIEVMLSYRQELSVTNSQTERDWRIPFVVVPRYARSYEGENARIQPEIGYNKTVISLELTIVHKNLFVSLSSSSHPIQVSTQPGKTIVRLAKSNEKPDSDFVLHMIESREPKQLVFTETDPKLGTFSLLQVTPVIKKDSKENKPQAYGFVLDHSGSMEGEKLTQAKLALKLCLRQLNQGDSFSMIAFDDRFISFSKSLVLYTQESMENADKWIDTITADGGTEILEPLSLMLKMLDPKAGGTILLFTDGQVSDESSILTLLSKQKGAIQCFPFGIDTAVNQSFIDGLAREGNGIPEYIYPGERIEDKVLRQFDRIHAPYWDEVDIEGDIEVYPKIPSRLFAGETYTMLVRGSSKSGHAFSFTLDGKKTRFLMPKAQLVESGKESSFLPAFWAIKKIRTLEKILEGAVNPRRKPLIQKEIVAISKEYGVLSTLTSLVAVMPREKKAKGVPTFVKIPICAPKGWDMLDNRTLYICHGSAGLPEAEPLTGAVRHFTKASLPKSSITPISTTPPVETWEDRIRMTALLQKADGSVGSGKKGDTLSTILFVLTFLMNESTIQSYRKAILKAVQYLLKQLSHYPLFEACALQGAVKASIVEQTLAGDRIQECMNTLSKSEREIVTLYLADNPRSLCQIIDPSITESHTKEEITDHLIAKILRK